MTKSMKWEGTIIKRPYQLIVGTGGIGKGILFCSDMMETLGRSESRMVWLSNAKDYCKMQIVFYYIAAFTSSFSEILPIGYVGNDETGQMLVEEMKRVGMDTKYIGFSSKEPTMLSICLQYPDKEGCNITAGNISTECVTENYIEQCMEQINMNGKTIVVALPEVPVKSRLRMLEIGKKKHAFTVLSVAAAEAEAFLSYNAFVHTDLLAVNQEEAVALLGASLTGEALTKELFQKLYKSNPHIKLIVTCGAKGAYTCMNETVEFIPTISTHAINTTGAGDAFLGGTIAGLAGGLSFQKGRNDDSFGSSRLNSAAELGAICSAMAVEVADSIAFQANPESVAFKIRENHWNMDASFENVITI